MGLFWAVDSYVDGVIFGERGYLPQLLDPSKKEITFRIQAFLMLVLFACYTWRQTDLQLGLKASLEQALAELKTARAQAEGILESMGDAVTVQDTDMRIMYQNQAHKKMMGDHAGEFCYAAYRGNNGVCSNCELVKSFADGRLYSRETCTDTPAGPSYREVNSAPLWGADGVIVGGIETVRDITERKRSEEAIRSLNLDLQQQTLALQASNRELEAFSYSLSHDLRSPLTSISLAVQIISSSYGESLDEAGRGLVQVLAKGCGSMKEIIEGMLLLCNVTKREITSREVDLSGLAWEVIAELALSSGGRTVEVEISPELAAWCDPQMMRLLLENLLGNAWKYTSKTAEPRIEFGRDQENGEPVYFVRDNGAGFDMAVAGCLFKPFQRLHRASDFPGTGIGLATVQRIIDRHHGRVWCTAAPDQGATFFFTFGPPHP